MEVRIEVEVGAAAQAVQAVQAVSVSKKLTMETIDWGATPTPGLAGAAAARAVKREMRPVSCIFGREWRRAGCFGAGLGCLVKRLLAWLEVEMISWWTRPGFISSSREI